MSLIISVLLLITSSLMILYSIDSHFNIANSQAVLQNSNVSYYIDNNQSLPKISFQYPSFWTESNSMNNHIITITSPVKTIGVIIQAKPFLNNSVDEITMKMIDYLDTKYYNFEIVTIEEGKYPESDELQSLIFTYGNDITSAKLLQIWKLHHNYIFIFTYFAPVNLFDTFVSAAAEIYKSIRISTINETKNMNLTSNMSMDSNNGNFTEKITSPKGEPTLVPLLDLERFITYHNKTSGIKISYPSVLNVLEKNNGVSFKDPESMVSASIGALPSFNNTVEQFINDRLTFLNSTLNNFKIQNFSQSFLFGYPTNMILYKYTSPSGNEKNQGMELWKIEGSKIHIFTIHTREDIFYTLLPTISYMIESIRWNAYT